MTTYETIDGQDRVIPGVGVTVDGKITTDKVLESAVFKIVTDKPQPPLETPVVANAPQPIIAEAITPQNKEKN